MIKLTWILLVMISFEASAQFDSGLVMVHKDSRLSLLIKKQIQINEESTRDARRSMPGFRLQVINTTNRGDAMEAKTKVYQLYPDLKAYLLYQSPYYRLKVGNFKTRQEAEDYRKSLSRDFNNTVFIVRDVIEVKPEIELTEQF